MCLIVIHLCINDNEVLPALYISCIYTWGFLGFLSPPFFLFASVHVHVCLHIIYIFCMSNRSSSGADGD